MGMFAVVHVDNSIELPHFPDELDRGEMSWQSKQGLDVYGGPYRITADGRLERKEESYREKSEEEKREEAQEWGFDSWDEYMSAYDEHDGLYPDRIDWDPDEDGYENHPPVYPRERLVEETYWVDHDMHGTFEFHQLIKEDPISYETKEFPTGETMERPSEYALDVFLEYEARFTDGDLDEIVFMGARLSRNDNPIENALDKIEEWREWRASDASRLDGEGDRK